MAEPQVAVSPDSPGKKTRERSTIQFPYVDLDSAIGLARAMYREQGAASCDLDQLSSWSGHGTAASGTFRNRVQAARYFGLIRLEHQHVTLTPLGRDILEDQTAREAKVKAFLSVPLYKKLFEAYRGRALPPDVGLENQVRSLGVAAKQANKARQVFKRSAEEAGFFAQGRDRLVLPASVDLTSPAKPEPQRERGALGKLGTGGAPPSGIHPTIRVLLNALPSAGDAWPVEEQEVWLDLLRSVLAQVYPAEAESVGDSEP